jgi:putative transposase
MKLLAFCIMPDHFHIVMFLLPGRNLSELMKATSKFTSRELNKLLGRLGKFWQQGFHDHRCRDEREVHDLCLYTEHNPVRKGLVSAAELWPYSSAFESNKRLLDRDWWP